MCRNASSMQQLAGELHANGDAYQWGAARGRRQRQRAKVATCPPSAARPRDLCGRMISAAEAWRPAEGACSADDPGGSIRRTKRKGFGVNPEKNIVDEQNPGYALPEAGKFRCAGRLHSEVQALSQARSRRPSAPTEDFHGSIPLAHRLGRPAGPACNINTLSGSASSSGRSGCTHALMASADLAVPEGGCRSELLRDMVLPHQYADQQSRFGRASAAPELDEACEPACGWEAHSRRLHDYYEAESNAKAERKEGQSLGND